MMPIARFAMQLVRDNMAAPVSEEFTPENGMLTPSLKIKRRAILEKYGDQIDDMYEGDDPLIGRDVSA